jgi:hypothetical protein
MVFDWDIAPLGCALALEPEEEYDTSTSPVLSLPIEMVHEIVGYLDLKDKASLIRACRCFFKRSVDRLYRHDFAEVRHFAQASAPVSLACVQTAVVQVDRVGEICST